MDIGVVKESKDQEYRVALTPSGARQLVNSGHRVKVEYNAGIGSGFSDLDYQTAGAELVPTNQAWNNELVVKIKEPQSAEFEYIQDQLLFTYFHLAGSPIELTQTLLKNSTTAIAYETVTDLDGKFPLLAPMSAVAGSMAITVGNFYLSRPQQGKGMLLGQILKQHFGKVVIIGDGIVGQHAAKAAAGMGANVFLCGRKAERAGYLKKFISKRLQFFLSSPASIAAHLLNADLVVGGVLSPGAHAPHLITESMVKTMQPGSVIVDVSIDQGGCVETSRPTTHSAPIFQKHGITHYCVTNMPGAYPHTSTKALTRATMPYIEQLAEEGLRAFTEDPNFANGINTYRGRICCQAVAGALNMTDHYCPYNYVES